MGDAKTEVSLDELEVRAAALAGVPDDLELAARAVSEAPLAEKYGGSVDAAPANYDAVKDPETGELRYVDVFGERIPVGKITELADPRCGNCWTAYGTEHQGSYVVTRVEKGARQRYRQLCECALRRYVRRHPQKAQAPDPVVAPPSDYKLVGVDLAKPVNDAAERRAAQLEERLARAREALSAAEAERDEHAAPYRESWLLADRQVGKAAAYLDQARDRRALQKLQVMSLANDLELLKEKLRQAEAAVAEADEVVRVKERTLDQMNGAEAGASRALEEALRRNHGRRAQLAKEVDKLERRLAAHRVRSGLDAPGKDACEVCRGERGGTPGNENVVDGKIMCDDCHARAIEQESR